MAETEKAVSSPNCCSRSRQDKEQLLADVATLRQQIIDLGRNAERLEAEIAHLNKIQDGN